MGHGKFTFVVEHEGERHKLCKIWYGSDGSYYVTAPYHPDGKARLFKARVNYAKEVMDIPFEETISLSSLDDDRRLKLSHHPDGFVQFSGEGVLSGREASGDAKGIGVVSWPLSNPEPGPAFGLSVRGIERFQVAGDASSGVVEFGADEVRTAPHFNTLTLEGHYFSALWRRFIRRDHLGR